MFGTLQTVVLSIALREFNAWQPVSWPTNGTGMPVFLEFSTTLDGPLYRGGALNGASLFFTLFTGVTLPVYWIPVIISAETQPPTYKGSRKIQKIPGSTSAFRSSFFRRLWMRGTLRTRWCGILFDHRCVQKPSRAANS